MAVNDFLTFAGDPAANVMTQSAYADVGFTARPLGFSTGTALSVQLNKVWRQASLISSMIGQFTCDATGLDMLDDGSPSGLASLETHFTTAITTIARAAIGTGYLPIVGGTLTGPLTINAAATQLSISATAGQWATMNMGRQQGQGAQIAAYTGTSPRWAIALADSTPEVGSNAGSNWSLARFADNGTYLGAPLSISRATGVVNFSQVPTFNNGPLPYLPLVGGTLSGVLVVGGTGIDYSNYYPGHFIAFGWDGTHIASWVDNVYMGEIVMFGDMYGWVGGNYLSIYGGTLYGDLQCNASLVVNGAAGFRSTVWFSNLGDFSNFYDGRSRFRQWAGGWYDYWDGTNGNRNWVCATGHWMTFDGIGNLSISNQFSANGSRIRVIGGGNPSVCCWWTGGVAKGMWVDGSGLWLGQMDASGNPTRADMLLDNGGYVTVYSSGNVGGTWNASTLSSFYLYASYSTIYGNEQVNGNITVNNHVQCASMNASTDASVNGQFNIFGYLNCAAAAQVNGGLTCESNVAVWGQISVNAWIIGSFRTSTRSSFPAFHSYNTAQGYAGDWYCDSNGHHWCGADGAGNPSTGTLMTLDWAGNLSVSSRVLTPSDAKLKNDIKPSAGFDSLAALRALRSIAFEWKSGAGHQPFGLLASDVAGHLPDVVMTQEDTDYLDVAALMTHTIRAVQQLADKIEGIRHA